MRKTVSIFIVMFALSLLPLAGVGHAQDRDDAARAAKAKQKKATDKDKDKDKDKDRRMGKAAAAKLTKPPVIEYVGPTSAVIAWSTNVNSSTLVRYGTNPNALNEKAERPWGGLTHRLEIKNLKPNTTYYFDVESGHAQGTGSEAESGKMSFHTPPKGAKAEHYPKPGPGF